MVGKRKGEDLREKIAKMARAAESNNQLDYKKACSEVPNILESNLDRLGADGLTSIEFFSKILKTATKLDRILEYLLFKQNLPDLLPDVKSGLDDLVRRELRVEEALAKAELGGLVTSGNGDTPLLDALGLKTGQPVAHILAPPTVDCLLCSKRLTKHNHPSTVALFALTGPLLASKYSWRYRHLHFHFIRIFTIIKNFFKDVFTIIKNFC